MTTLDRTLSVNIASAADPIQRNCLRAELAAYVARLGKYERAKGIIAELRADAQWSSVRLIALIMFAEAITQLQDEFASEALDRLRRAFAIAKAANLQDLASTIAAWLAHFEYNAGSFGAAATWVQQCRDRAVSMSDSGRARLFLTFADATRHVGNFAESDRWYSASRRLAVGLGDEAFLAACMYNRAAYGIARARLDCLSSGIAPDLARRLMLEIESAANYAAATGNLSAKYLQQMWRARLLMILGKHAEALPLIEAVMTNLPESKHPKMRVVLDADVATCQLHLGNSNRAGEIYASLPRETGNLLESDDEAIYAQQLAVLARRFGDRLTATQCDDASAQALARHIFQIACLKDLSAGFEA